MQEVLFTWVGEGLNEIDRQLDTIKPTDPMLDIIWQQMFDLETKMVQHMVNQGDYRILDHIEKIQDLRNKVKTIQKHASTM
jgi:hypothetical protein